MKVALTIERFEPHGAVKRVELEFARAYPARGLKRLDRAMSLHARGPDAGCVVIEDAFAFSGKAPGIEEAFTTWGTVSVRGGVARVRHNGHALRLRIVEPAGAAFTVKDVPVMMARATEPSILRRIACKLPRGADRFVMEARVL